MRGENLKYISEQLGHHSIQITIDLYGHLIPGMNKGVVDALAEATNATPAQLVPMSDDRSEEEDAGSLLQDNELDGGPCRGRTYGPLIKRDKWPFLTRLAIARVSPIHATFPYFRPFHGFYDLPSFLFPSCS